MTPRDFCYWLQGHFEVGDLANLPKAMSSAQVLMVKKHLELTFMAKVDKARFPDATVGGEFCSFLEGVLAATDLNAGLSEPLAMKVRAKLNDVFVHVIDPTFANRAELVRHHEGETDGPVLGGGRRSRGLGETDGGLVAMC
jgi:hypothetical protein